MNQNNQGPVISRSQTTAAQRAANPTWKRSTEHVKTKKSDPTNPYSLLAGDTDQSIEPTEKLDHLPNRVFALLAAILFVFIFGLLGKTTLAMKQNQLGRDVSNLTNEKIRLTEVNRELKANLARLVVFEDLEVIAREHLGLVNPQKGQIEIIDTSKYASDSNNSARGW
ncbi:MAG: hypothetical protein LBT47_07315 [Deltaproteobacteria bacterium]|nr:hypothetical protein [Deltaproteobacteria bacterium]